MSYLQEKISYLVEQGYELRFPGGKNRKESWEESYASFGVVARNRFFKDGSNVIEILFVPYKKKAFQKVHPFSEGAFSEKPSMTLEREVMEETNVRLLEYDTLSAFPVEDNEKPGEVHMKYAYIATQYDAANIRRKLSPSQPNLGIPLWTPLWLVKKKPILFSGHIWILDALNVYLENFEDRIPSVYKS